MDKVRVIEIKKSVFEDNDRDADKLRSELKEKGIKVCALCPGSVSTEFANVASSGVRKEVKGGHDPV